MSQLPFLSPRANGGLALGAEKRGFPSRLASLGRSLPRRIKTVGTLLCVILTLVLTLVLINTRRTSSQQVSDEVGVEHHDDDFTTISGGEARTSRLHVMIPASSPDQNLCKLILGCSLLGYPTPTLLAWEESFDRKGLLGNGSHLAKASRALSYLDSLDLVSQGDDLVLMLDADDVHLQLPRSVLVDRYYEARGAAQRRLVNSTGDAAVAGEDLRQLVMFGAGKSCAPNQPHTVACYAVPDSPLPADLYGPNTDTVVGHDAHYSFRQRYLSSGYVLGPARAMHRIFAKASRQIEGQPDDDPVDNGSDGSDFVYHGADQSVFATMYGRQEWAREKLRLRHSPKGTKPRTSQVFGSFIDNVLSPSFTHEEVDFDLSQGNPHEFGIFLDYWSDLGHQTVNSELDARWLVYNGSKPVGEQVGDRMKGFDCPVRAPQTPPDDIMRSKISIDPEHRSAWWNLFSDGESPWLNRPLYTNVCTSRIPVLRHMNGNKTHRGAHWSNIWYQPQARDMLKDLDKQITEKKLKHSFEMHKAEPTLEVAGGAWSDTGKLMKWGQLCPSEYDDEIFRDT